MIRTYRVLALTIDRRDSSLKVLDRTGKWHSIPISEDSCEKLNDYLAPKLTDAEMKILEQERERATGGS